MVVWVDEHIKENPTLDQMADYVGYSTFYCSSKFHEHVGITFKQYVSKRKLNLATLELKNTKHSIMDIAIELGFSSHEAFSRAFFSRYGCTPRQYRKQQLS